MNNDHLSKRFLFMLAHEIGVMDMSHVAVVLNTSRASHRRRLDEWQKHGAVNVLEVECRRVVSTAPLAIVTPGESSVSPEKLRYRAHRRWLAVKPRLHRVVVGGPRLSVLFGGSQLRRPNPGQIAHDLGLADARLSHLDRRWIPEPQFSGSTKRPDACLVDSEGRPMRLIEHVGSYSRTRIEESIALASQSKLTMELW